MSTGLVVFIGIVCFVALVTMAIYAGWKFSKPRLSIPTLPIESSNLPTFEEAARQREQISRETVQMVSASESTRVNLIWEYTQAAVAIIVVIALVVFEFEVLVLNKDLTADAATASTRLANAFFLVIGFYFGRTKVGSNTTNINNESKNEP